MAATAAKAGIHLLSSEKPHSSVSVWIDTLCQDRYEEDDYDGIGELVQSINLQTTGWVTLCGVEVERGGS